MKISLFIFNPYSGIGGGDKTLYRFLNSVNFEKYNVSELTYQSRTEKDQFAVFSEIYYKDGWNAYVDGELMPHYQVNYVLRGMVVPAGNHTIEFKFEPKVIQKGSVISVSSYLILILVTLGWFFYDERKKKKNAS